MTEAEWLACEEPWQLLNADVGVFSERKLRLFAVACCDRIKRLICDSAGRNCVAVGRALADCTVPESSRRKAIIRAMSERSSVVATCVVSVPARDAAMRTSEHAAIEVAHERWPHLSELEERPPEWNETIAQEENAQSQFVRDIFGNPFRPVSFDPASRTDTAVALARQMYDSREFAAMPILADALQDAGCEEEQVLNHCRDANQVHVRGCWVCDLVLGKE